MPGLFETLNRAAELLDQEARSIHECHTFDGRWGNHPEDIRAEEDWREMRSVAKALRKAAKYMQANPLGGPAKVFDAIADQVRCGETLDASMRAFGVKWDKKAARIKRHN